MEAVSSRDLGRWSSVLTVRNVFLAGVIAVLVVFLLYPFVILVKQSLQGPDGQVYTEIFQTAGYRAVLWNTLQISLIATPVTVLAAFILSYFMWNASPFWARLTIVLLIIPYFTSLLVKVFSWTVILQDSGPINKALMAIGIIDEPVHLLFTRFAVIVGMMHYTLPLSVVPIYVALLRINKNLIKVSRSMGASRATTLFLVTIPMAKAGIVTSVVTTFVLAVGFFITPAMLGGRRDQMAANLIDVAVKKLYRLDLASGLSVILFISVLVLLPFALQMLKPPEKAS